VAPLLVGLALAGLHARFADYYAGTRWLVWLLGPSVTAFAVPIHDQWPLVRRYWRVLLLGIAAGSATALVSGWALASLLGIDGALRLTLLPRSISTPFAMQLSSTIGGVPELTALFVVVTGVLGAVIGEVLLARLPLRTEIARAPCSAWAPMLRARRISSVFRPGWARFQG
jgi:putative effector of murein hydrolase